MEAATLQKKKNSVNKGKLKKTIKNILSRPDPVFWPTILNEQEKIIKTALSKHRISIPLFKKLHWKELKALPKEQRPKPPKLERVNGFLFGISECCAAIQSRECSSIIIESTVNPQTIVHPVIEACVNVKTPIICLEGLRKLSASYFGISTSCLGIKNNYLQDVSDIIVVLAKDKHPQDKCLPQNHKIMEVVEEETKCEIAMDNQESGSNNLHLYRDNKKSRAFVPPSEDNTSKTTTKFIGQDFIEFPDKPAKQNEKKAYLKMTVKRIINNPNRVKAK